MAKSTLKLPVNILMQDVVFTYVNHSLWRASTKDQGLKIIGTAVPNYMVTGDGTDFCRVYKPDAATTGIPWRTCESNESPLTIKCTLVRI